MKWTSIFRDSLLVVLGLLCAMPAVAGTRTPSPQEILDNWAAAVGGRENIDGITTLASDAGITLFGMEGTIRQKMSRPADYLMELDLAGVFSVTHLASGGRTWVEDQDGNVAEVAGRERADMINSMYIENLNHLRSEAPASLIRKVVRMDEAGLLAVTMSVPEGSETVYFLDARSWLPVRSESTDTGGGTTTVTYSDWRPVQGVLFAHRVHQSDGEVQNDMTLTVSEIVVNPRWADDPFLVPDTVEAGSSIVDAKLAADIPVKLRGVHIYVDVMVNGQGPFPFVYDSGAGMTVINRGLAESLNLTLQGEIAGGGVGEGSVEVSLATGLDLGLPGIEARDQTVAVVDIENVLEKRIGTRVEGILGFGFISRFVSEIDYANSRLGLHDPATFTYTGPGTVVPMVTDGSTPHVEAVVQGHGGRPVTGYFMLDTGSGGAISMSGPFAARHGIVATMPKTVTNHGGFGVGGATTSTVGRLQSIQLGGIVFNEPIASVSHDASGAGADDTIAGLIGGRLMSRCRTFLDYEGGRLILEPYANLDDRFTWNKSGLTVTTGGRGDFHSFRVAAVVEESPAQAAGLRVGDELLAVGGRPAAEWEADELAELFRGKDQDLEILLRRDGRESAVSLKLREFI